MKLVRLHRQLHQERRKVAVLRQTRGLAMQRAAVSAPNTPRPSTPVQRLFDDVNRMHQKLTANEQTKQEILVNMLWNYFVAPNQRRYTKNVLRFSVLIAGVSLTCYSLLRQFLILPDYSTLFRHTQHDLSENSKVITDIASLKIYVPHLAEKIREQCNDCTKFGGYLAVDAISLTPHIYVTKDGMVEGVLDNVSSLSSDEMQDLRHSYIKYEEFVKGLENKTITDSFVYMYQPLVAGVKSVPIFVDPSTQGKATSHEIDRLSELTDMLEESGLHVEGLAFDGDSTYAKLHRGFFQSYYNNLSSDTSFRNYSLITGRSIVSDPLHLLKRGRYRLLSCRVHAGFENTTDSLISVDALSEQLHLPSVVFSDEKFTKMHDKLATRLFSLETLVSLMERRNITSLTYFLPLCLLTVALEESNLMVEERILFLEIGLYYMLAVYGMSLNTRVQLREFKVRTQTDVRLFDQKFLQEYCNTVVAILKVLFTVNGTVHLNSVGSNPVEHLFGLIRMRSRSVHTYAKLLRTMSKTMLAKKISLELGANKNIDKRISYFAVDVENDINHLRITNEQAREIAFSLLCRFGLPISVKELMVWDAFSANDLGNDVFEDLRARIIEVGHRCNKHGSRGGLSSTTASVKPNTQILARLMHRNILK